MCVRCTVLVKDVDTLFDDVMTWMTPLDDTAHEHARNLNNRVALMSAVARVQQCYSSQ